MIAFCILVYFIVEIYSWVMLTFPFCNNTRSLFGQAALMFLCRISGLWVSNKCTLLLNEPFSWQSLRKQFKKKKKKTNLTLPSAWHHLRQHIKTRQSGSVILHMVAGPSSSAAQMEELLGLGLGCCCFLQSVFLGPLVDEKGRTQRARQPLPQAQLQRSG